MVIAVWLATDGRLRGGTQDLVLWGSAVAAMLIACTVAAGATLGIVAWMSIGYLLYAALLATDHVVVIILALAAAFVPLAPRPRGSLALGVVVATVCAFAAREIVGLASTV